MLKLNELKIETGLWIALALIAVIFHANHPLDSDEGVILEGAWNIINNKELYVDFHSFIPPGSYYLIYFTWLVFGVSYFAAKAAAILLLILSAFGVYKISELIEKTKLNFVSPYLFNIYTRELISRLFLHL